MLASDPLRLRLRHLLWPFARLWLLFNGSLLGGCALLAQWLRPLQEPLSDGELLCLGLFLAGLTVVFGLSARLRLIQPGKRSRGGDNRSALGWVAAGTLALAAGTIVAGAFAWWAPAQHLPDLAALNRYPPARYYLPSKVRLDTTHCQRLMATYRVGGKSPSMVCFLALACPVVGRAAPGPPVAWVGYYYQRDTSAAKVGRNWEGGPNFLVRSQRAFAADVARPCYYFERRPATLRDQQHLLATIGPAGTEPQPLLLRPVYQPFAHRARTNAKWWVRSQAIGCALFCLLALTLPLSKMEVKRLAAPDQSLT